MATSSSSKTKKRRYRLETFIFVGIMGFFLCLGISLFLQSLRISTLTCIRLEPSLVNCNLQTRLIGLIPLRTYALEPLQFTHVEEQCADQRCEYALYLSDGAGEPVRFPFHKSTRALTISTADQIKNFIEDRDAERLDVREGLSIGGVAAGLLFIVVTGGGILLFWWTLRRIRQGGNG